MGDIKKLIIGSLLAILIVIVARSLIMKVKEVQSQDKNLYKDLVGLIDNKSVEEAINKIVILTLVIIAILLISLELSVFLPVFEWGWIDRGVLITSFATILGGFLGFVGALIGVIGTYGAFYLGDKKEKEDKKEDKNSTINFELELLQNLLEFTLQETNLLLECMIDEYIKFYNDNNIIDVLYMRCYNQNVVFDIMLEDLLSDNKQNLDMSILSSLPKEFDKEDIHGSLNVTFLDLLFLDENKYKELYYDINKLFCNNYNFNRLIYTDDWSKYILHLKTKEHYKISYIKDLLNWFTYLEDSNISSTVKKIKELELQVTKISSTEDIYKLNEMRELQLIEIMKFIKYRDGAIDILKDLFEEDYMEWDIKPSYEYLKDKIDYKSWIKRYPELEKNQLFA